jgi:hypothetical protein
VSNSFFYFYLPEMFLGAPLLSHPLVDSFLCPFSSSPSSIFVAFFNEQKLAN